MFNLFVFRRHTLKPDQEKELGGVKEILSKRNFYTICVSLVGTTNNR
jgi:hypothetical protein